MKDLVFLIDKFKNDLSSEGISQGIVANMEHLLGENFITNSHSIKNFTQHSSHINVNLGLMALEDYKTKLISNMVVTQMSKENSESIQCLKNMVHNLKSSLNDRFSYIFTQDEMKKLIVGYDKFFNSESNNDRDYLLAKDSNYMDYMYAFISSIKRDDSEVLMEYKKNLYDVLSHREDISKEMVDTIVENKIQNIKHNIFPVLFSNDDFIVMRPVEKINIFLDVGSDTIITLENMVNYLDRSNPRNVFKCINTLQDLFSYGTWADFEKYTEFLTNQDFEATHPFPYLYSMVILFCGY